MEIEKTLVTESEEQRSMFYRRLFQPSIGLHVVLALLCILFCLATCAPCSTRNHHVSKMDGMPVPVEYDACRSYGDNYVTGFHDFLGGDISSNYVQGNSPTNSGLETICTNPDFFCFPSTLPGFFAEEDNFKEVIGNQDDSTFPEASVPRDTWESNSSWRSDQGKFWLLGGKVVSCSLNSGMELYGESSAQGNNADRSNCSSCGGPSHKLHRPHLIPEKNSEVIKSDFLDGSSSPHVEISPKFLDWGQNYLYFPSLAFLAIANTCNDSILHIYEPFSTDKQFYPCDLGEVSLRPGEVASICFVFLPQQLGSSSAHLILQTTMGGFLIHAKGLAIESPYKIQPLVGLVVTSNESLSRNLSLHNPYDDTLFVRQVTAWISVSSGNTSLSAEAACKMDTFQGSDDLSAFLNGKEWLNIKSDLIDIPLMGLRPHHSWEINPHSTETVIEIDFSFGTEGKVFGAFCMQLQSSSQDRTETVLVPLEAEVHGKEAYSGLSGAISVSLESLVPCDDTEKIAIVLSLGNMGEYLISVSKISEVTESKKLFHIKYMEGLVLFPGSDTQIAVITYSHSPNDSQESPHEIPNVKADCKLLILTNDSDSPQIEIPCQDVVHTCARYQPASNIGYKLQLEKSKSGNAITGSLGGFIHSQSQMKLNALEIAEADELVLKNWRSQGTTRGMSVLDDNEVLFPMIPVGSHYSKWITVKNPSDQPVMMQLILNSGVIIDQCRVADNFVQQTLSSSLAGNGSPKPVRYGFSVPDTAVTEVHVHPHGRAVFGPIVFHPSNRCGWKGSALVRNNLSGVEWLFLHGFGGSLALVLLEGSELVQTLDFHLNLPIPLNISPPDSLFNVEDTRAACFRPVSKELYAKNTGDLPLEVRRIEVSGTNCGLDGFMVHTCKAFSLEPGESRKLLISYQTDLSAAAVHRDLELALSTGFLVIPMKARLPVYMLGLCRKSYFWILLKKLTLVVLVAVSVTFLIFCCILPQVMALGSQDYVFKTENGTISQAKKPSWLHGSPRNSEFSMCNNMDTEFSMCNNMDTEFSLCNNNNDGLLRTVREDETSKLGFVGRYSDCSSGIQDRRITTQHMKPQESVIGFSGTRNETPLLPYSSETKSTALVENSCSMEAPQTGNLTVRIGKESGRRRRKRRAGGASGGLTGLLEVSSSQSGNSTPSSPLSPVMSSTPKRMWPLSPDVDNVIDTRNPFAKVEDRNLEKEHVFRASSEPTSLESNVSAKYAPRSWSPSAQPQTPAPRKTTIGKPVLLPSATFPCTGHRVPGLVSPSAPITPHARAPGSNLGKEKSIKVVEKDSLGDKFTYDIWGNHFSGFHLVGMGRAIEDSTMISSASQGDTQSFFVRGPQILMQKSQTRAVSPAPKLPPCAVTFLNQKG